MSYEEIDATLGAPLDLPPVSSEEAAEIAHKEEALKAERSDPDDDEDEESPS
jgi:hypothetical protein